MHSELMGCLTISGFVETHLQYKDIFIYYTGIFWIPGPSSRSAIQLRRPWNSVLNVLRIFWGMIMKIQFSLNFKILPKTYVILII